MDGDSSDASPPMEAGSVTRREFIKQSLGYNGRSKSAIPSRQQANSEEGVQSPRRRGRPPKNNQRLDVAVGKGLLITSRGKHRNPGLVIHDKGKPNDNAFVSPLPSALLKRDEDPIRNSRRHASPPTKKQKHDVVETMLKRRLSKSKDLDGTRYKSQERNSAPVVEDANVRLFENQHEANGERWVLNSKGQECPPIKKQKRDSIGIAGRKDLSKQSRPNIGMLGLTCYEKEKSQARQNVAVNSRSLLQDAVDSTSEPGDSKHSYSSDGKEDKELRKSSQSKEMNGNGPRVHNDSSISLVRERLSEFQKEKITVSDIADGSPVGHGNKKTEGLSDTSEKTHGRGRKKVASVDLPPDELRCIRSDGRSWRCTAYAIPGGRRCQKHLLQLVAAQKRQQMNKGSAFVRVTNGKAKFQPSDFGITTEELNRSESPSSNLHEKALKKLLPQSSSPLVQKSLNISIPSNKTDTLSVNSKTLNQKGPLISDHLSPNHVGKGQTKCSPDGDTTKLEQGKLCHQCQRNDKGAIVFCSKCNRRRYCLCCLTRWYPDLSEQEIKKACPFCRGRCVCKSCLRLKRHTKEEVHMSKVERLKCLHYMLGIILPFLKQLNEVQRLELELESTLRGAPITKLARAPIGRDDCVLCDNCGTSIVDFHRSCPDCDYDLCLTCCQELRQGKQPGVQNLVPSPELLGQQLISEVVDRILPDKGSVENLLTCSEHDESLGKPTPEAFGASGSNKVEVDIAQGASQSAVWRTNKDSSIPCAPAERGCGSPLLILKTLHRANYLENLVKEVESFIDSDVYLFKSEVEACTICDAGSSASSGKDLPSFRLAAQRSNTNDNFIYTPHCHDAKYKELEHFQRHWVRGEPVIVKDVLTAVSDVCWEPMDLWRATQEFARRYVHDESKLVTAVDCFDGREVDVSIYEFLRGYEVGYMDHNSWPKMMKLDWPPSNVFEEKLPRHCAEFIAGIPFAEYTHPRKGILNLAAKFPEGAAKPDLGPKSYITYGVSEELGIGDSVTKLQCGASDMVCVLLHTSEAKLTPWQWKQAHRSRERLEAGNKALQVFGTEKGRWEVKTALKSKDLPSCSHEETSLEQHDSSEQESRPNELAYASESDDSSAAVSGGSKVTTHGGAVWDVFRRQDVPKLQEYLEKYSKDFNHHEANEIVHPIHDQLLFLNGEHKKKLKEEFQVEAWTFEQNLGEAVFIPAGCPYQVRNLKSCTKVALDFVSPENLQESLRVTEEYRLLPRYHHANEDKLQVKNMIVHAASQAVVEIKRLRADKR
ncbi:hypothetical protein O6H91_18G048900 [Diphasiastrum complanatum]|uniref:Uncharacterized protein n=1 Tax=Diphasiastrum complanatum TaxID=34168 RepID=A0ACC2B0R9_DIPCM|nr:hypothetical protein O6H91_18G048900 [Diphasiastrum complanatum]